MVTSESQRRLRKSKESERVLGRFLLAHNGPDPVFKHIMTSTGRTGHLTDLQVDSISLDYAAENKNVRVSKKFLDWWVKIGQIAVKHGKHPLLRIVPSNPGKWPELHIISAERHAQLLDIERAARAQPEQTQADTGKEWC